MIYAALFALIIGAAFFHAVMDANAHLRIHLAQHPLRDSWHVAQWLRMACLIGIGLAWSPCARDPWACAITAVCGVVLGRLVWTAVYKTPWTWYRLDETWHISTGWKWLDKLLGLHW